MNDYQSLQTEHSNLTDQYLTAELENFQLNCYYEQILAEERLKLTEYQSIYSNKFRRLHRNDSSSPPPPPIPDND